MEPQATSKIHHNESVLLAYHRSDAVLFVGERLGEYVVGDDDHAAVASKLDSNSML